MPTQVTSKNVDVQLLPLFHAETRQPAFLPAGFLARWLFLSLCRIHEETRSRECVFIFEGDMGFFVRRRDDCDYAIVRLVSP